MKKLRLALLALGAIAFIAFTSLQFNDLGQYGNGDAWSWIALYSFTALLSAVLMWKRVPKIICHFWAGFSWGSLFFRLQDDMGNFHFDRLHPSTFWNERGTEMVQQSNECGGLLILAIWATALIVCNRDEKK